MRAKLMNITLLSTTALAQITSCPTTENVVITNGSHYKICLSSDYQGLTTAAYHGITDMPTCVSICNQRTDCTKAVYQMSGNVCHLKAGSLNWISNPGFNSARLFAKDGDFLDSCPVTPQQGQVTKKGSSFSVCQNTDYAGNTSWMQPNVASAVDCMSMCEDRADCDRAVYNQAQKNCWLKNGGLRLVAKAGADTLQLVKPGQGTSSTTLATVQTTTQAPVPTTTQAPVPTTTQAPVSTTTKAPVPTTAAPSSVASTTSRPASPQPGSNSKGSWGPVIGMPVIPVAGYIVPEYPESSRMMMFSSWGPYDFSGPTGITQFADFNYRTGAVSERQVTETHHDMFCPGISSLEDGSILITGGSNAEASSLYHGQNNSFTRAGDLKIPRGYQASTALSNGKVFTIGGSFSGANLPKNGEVYDPATQQWTLLPNADVNAMRTSSTNLGNNDDHGWLFGWRDGSVFQAGPSKEMHWYGTTGSGSVSSAGIRDPASDSMCGVWAMYDAGKIFSATGSAEYTDTPAHNHAYLISIDQVGQPARVEQVANIIHPRGFGNAVVLPDGTIIITGGMPVPVPFSDYNAVLVAELFDPVTKTFRELAAMSEPRNYHSIALLLPDGTVFVGGGGLCPTAYGASDAHCNRAIDHPNGQIFTPPYLLNSDGSAATRPVITSLSSDSAANGFSVRVGGTLNVQVNNGDGVTFALLRLGSNTHSVNTDQRRIALTNVVSNGNGFTIQLPADSGVVIPGAWFLFALSKNGVPSYSKTIRVTR